jgi:hypothetical protein
MHNGYFKSLKGVVHFYSTRHVLMKFGSGRVALRLPTRGDSGLTVGRKLRKMRFRAELKRSRIRSTALFFLSEAYLSERRTPDKTLAAPPWSRLSRTQRTSRSPVKEAKLKLTHLRLPCDIQDRLARYRRGSTRYSTGLPYADNGTYTLVNLLWDKLRRQWVLGVGNFGLLCDFSFKGL